MDDIFRKRELVKQAYPHSKTWPEKVKKMPDSQIVAVFLRLRRQGKI
ncbi:hypothetical protein SEA_CLUBPENGUIN_55 [Streptomyces phage ClubPenguin]|nr:hypothetical protein SEA_CLUBPENGUIN_55 [Streptomyces phage ClubPenguin]